MEQVIIYGGRGGVVAARRRLAQMPKVMGVLDPLERTVFNAAIGRPFSEYRPEELTAELMRSLRTIARDIGLRESELDNYIVARLVTVLCNYYGGFTMQDFRLAFEMSVTGELDEYLPRRGDGTADRGHYHNFSTEYVCRILNAYRSRRAAVLRKVADAEPKQEQPRDPEQEARASANIRQHLLEDYDYFCRTGTFPAVSSIGKMLYYNELAALGFAPEVEVTLADQREVLAATVREYLSKDRLFDASRLKKEGTDSNEIQHGAFLIARDRALRETFARMRDNGVNLNDYIAYE